ncbi:protein EXORDIUM-like 2 [Fagus crenata]
MVTMFWKSMLFPLIFALALAPMSHGHGVQQRQNQPSLAPTSNEIKYHGGPLLTKPTGINIYLIWYGRFSRSDKSSITDFIASLSPRKGVVPHHQKPTVATWWKTIQTYKDKAGKSVSRTVRLVKQISDKYSLGKNITRAQIANFVKHKIETKALPLDRNGIYLVLTSKDVVVERFCTGSCGFHDNIVVATKSARAVHAHVGNPSVQCPGLCAWPYSLPAYGPPGKALVAPNGVGTDGIIMNIATVLAGAVTNPFKNGYFQGHPLAPLEAVTACPGIFGEGAYPGYPGKLLVDKISKASYNAYGANGRKFLLPAIWETTTSKCKVIH